MPAQRANTTLRSVETRTLGAETRFWQALRRLQGAWWTKLPLSRRLFVRTMARLSTDTRRRQVMLFFDTSMTVMLPDAVSEAIFTYGLFDPVVTWLVLRCVSPGETALDVGAHLGYVTLLLAHLVGESGHIHAFEPTAVTYGLLRENIAVARNVTAVASAVSDSVGTVEMRDFGPRYAAWNTIADVSRLGQGASVPARRVLVETLTLDAYCQEHDVVPSFAKIDVENSEDRLVRGFRRTLETARPLVLLEARSQQAMAALSQLVELQYRLVVSRAPGTHELWTGSLEEANALFKDILFVPLERLDRVLTRFA
jgi:FkbM family methyltransferase